MPSYRKLLTTMSSQIDWKAVIAVTSSFLLYFPNGVTQLFGNLFLYTSSYSRKYVDSNDSAAAAWIFSFYICGATKGILVASWLTRRLSERLVCILAAILTFAGMAVGYFTINVSIFFLSFSIGYLSGFATGLASVVGQQIMIQRVTIKRRSLCSGIISSASAVDSLIMNQFITRYINPDNEKTVLSDENEPYFNQTELLDRVPFVFLYVGAFHGTVTVIGCLLIYDKRQGISDLEMITDVNTPKTGIANKTGDNSNIDDKSKHYENTPNGFRYNYDTIDNTKNRNTLHNDIVDAIPLKTILTSKLFYTGCVICMISFTQLLITSQYYKVFGEIWIHEDHFLTNLTTILALSLMVSRSVWGAAIDRYGLRNMLVLYFAQNAFGFSWIYVSAVLGRYFYSFTLVLIWSSSTSHPVFVICIAMKIFEKDNFPKILGIFSAFMVLISILDSMVLNFGFQEEMNWIGLFVVTSGLCLLGMMIAILGLPPSFK